MLLLHLPLMRLHPCSFVLQRCFIHYINPLNKGLSSITKMGEIESAWLPPCVVLVINDNLYGLMFVLSYLSVCPFDLLNLPLLESRLREEEYVLIKAKCELINTQVDVKICRRVPLQYWCMGEQFCESSPSEVQVDHAQGKGMILIGFLFYRSHDVS